MGREITQVLHGKIPTVDGPTVNLKIDTEGDKTRGAGSLFLFFMARLKI